MNGNGTSRFDSRITMGNIITMVLVLAGILASYVRSESRAETMDTRLMRMEGKQDWIIEQIHNQGTDIEVIKTQIRRP